MTYQKHMPIEISMQIMWYIWLVCLYMCACQLYIVAECDSTPTICDRVQLS